MHVYFVETVDTSMTYIKQLSAMWEKGMCVEVLKGENE